MSAPVRVFTAATDGWSTTSPVPLTYTRVRAAPRSTAKWQRRNCSRLAVTADPPECGPKAHRAADLSGIVRGGRARAPFLGGRVGGRRTGGARHEPPGRGRARAAYRR